MLGIKTLHAISQIKNIMIIITKQMKKQKITNISVKLRLNLMRK